MFAVKCKSTERNSRRPILPLSLARVFGKTKKEVHLLFENQAKDKANVLPIRKGVSRE